VGMPIGKVNGSVDRLLVNLVPHFAVDLRQM
jgi:hypothetical protein